MKKIIFKVSSQKDFSIASLMKEVNKVSCRILFNLAEGFVTVENVDTNMIDYIIDLINKYYSILSVDIDNTIETVKKEDNVTVIKEPKSQNDLNIKNIEFENKYIENLINKLLKTASWALYTNNTAEKEIGEFILTCISELSLTYSNIDCIEFNVGDVVDCNYGTHLPGEINGGHVPAIVCNILNNGMAYLVPITKTNSSSISNSILQFSCPENIIYDNPNFTGGSALLNKAKYLRPERFHKVIGKVSPDFLATILKKLPLVFNFTNYTSNSSCTNSVSTKDTHVLNSSNISKTTNNVTIPCQTSERVGLNETALLNVIGPALDKLDKHKTVENQLESFLSEIGMSSASKFVKESFIIACKIDNKITFDNILLELQCAHPYINNINIIKSSLKEDFKNWLKHYPELANRPRLSIVSLLKVFAKKFI